MKASTVAAFSLMVVIGLPSLAKGSREKPTIARCPISTTVQVGDTISWTCVGDPKGGTPISFAWYNKSWKQVWDRAIFSTVMKKRDSGDEYKCRVWYSQWSSVDSDWLRLTVNERDEHKQPDHPTMIWYPAGPVNVGDTITMVCLADMPDSYNWYSKHNDGGIYSPVSLSTADKEYVFSKKVEPDDSGTYFCQAIYYYSHCYSKNSTERKLEINDPPNTPTITGWPDKSTLDVGMSLSLICRATTAGGSFIGLSYIWYKDSAILPKQTKATYSKRNVKSTDGGEYVCQAESDGIPRNSTVRTLFVKDSETWTRNCSTVWTGWMSPYPDSHIEYNNQFCVEISSQGRNRNWSLQQKNRSRSSDPANTPTITGWPDKSTLDVGMSLSLTCSATTAGGSSISYIWYKDSAILPKQTNAKYSIKNVKSTDGGEYVCQAESDGIPRNSTVRTLFVKDSETWTRNCSTAWTVWMSPYPDSHIEYSNQFCVQISSQGRNMNWTLQQKNRSRRASEFDGAFRSIIKTFTEALLDNTSTEFEQLRDEFMPLLEKVYTVSENSDAGNPVKEVLITGFKEGSVIVHYRVVLTTSVEITDPLANISKTLADYLEKNPADREKYGVAPSSIISSGGCMPIKASPPAENSQNQGDVILAVSLTIIVLLVVAVVVLVIFLVRMKRSLLEKEPGGDTVAFRAESNGSGPAVNVQDRNASGARSNFDPYSAHAERNVDADDDYMSLGEQKMIPRPKVVNDNAVYETEEGDYLDIIGEGMVVSASLQAKLEDGYRRNEADAPVYRVQHIKPEPSNATSAIGNEDAVYSFADDTGASSKAAGGRDVESVYALAEGNGDVYAIPVKKQFRNGGVPVYSLTGDTIPEQAPGKNISCDNDAQDAVYSLAEIPGGIPKASQYSLAGNVDVDNEDYYSQPYGRTPGAKHPDKNNMAAEGWQRKVLPSDGDGDEYSRLQLPTLSKPSTMQYLEKKPKEMKGVNSGREDVQDDEEEEDYEYGTACEVIL